MAIGKQMVGHSAPVQIAAAVKTGEEIRSLRPKMTDGCGSYRLPETD